MSGEKRRRSRVQGGWAKQVQKAKPTSQTPATQTPKATKPHHKTQGETSRGGQAFIFKDSKEYKMPGVRPPNFSWVIEGILAGSGLPSQQAHLQYMVDQGVKHLVSLTDWKPRLHICPGLQHTHIAIEEFEAPNLRQATNFVSLVENARQKNEAVTVHCHWGLGRTGTMLACYLVKHQDLPPAEAIREVRRLRPYSIETYGQEDLIYQYAEYLRKENE